MNILQIAVIINLIAGLFNMIISGINLFNGKFENMVFNIGMAICSYLIAIVCAIESK